MVKAPTPITYLTTVSKNRHCLNPGLGIAAKTNIYFGTFEQDILHGTKPFLKTIAWIVFKIIKPVSATDGYNTKK